MAGPPGPKANVQPPVLISASRSLLGSIPATPLEVGAAAGVTHIQGRGAGVSDPLDWCDPGTVTIVDACGLADRDSFALVAGELRPSQSTFSANRVSLAERQASAQVNLERSQSYAIAYEMLYGVQTTAHGWGNPFLADMAKTVIITASAQPYNRALDRITSRWAELMLGERGLIHMGPSVARALLENYAIEERGTNLYDKAMEHQIIVDAAYSRAAIDGPAARDPLDQIEWIFMSPNIDIRLSPIEFLPATEAEVASAIDRATNVLSVRAYRVASYTWEQPAVGGTLPPVLAIPVDLCNTECIPAAS